MNNQRSVYINGVFVPESEAKISIFDSALMFGDMVFEMTRSFNKKQFKLREHLERLYVGIEILRIPIGMTIDELEKACYETIDKNEKVFNSNDEHRLMINVSRGPLGLYAPVFDGKLEPTIVIADFPLKWTVAAMSPLFDSGINAVIPNQRAIPAYLMDPKIKNRSRLFYQMANIEVSQMKGENNWALLLDPDGYITEGTGDNFFIVKNGEILTPEGRNILRGVSREYIFEIAKELGIPCKECNIEAYDVHTADEAFMTGTPFCILPTVSLQGLTIGTGKMGEITSSLLERWSKNVGLDIKKQIQDYGKEISKFNSDAPNPYQFKK
jgi:branched-chain amino acid aminotransferase|tara:strand:+ start:1705 stop:2682 length:978 start_codon:yes stop_codon:yes gene_type:complete